MQEPRSDEETVHEGQTRMLAVCAADVPKMMSPSISATSPPWSLHCTRCSTNSFCNLVSEFPVRLVRRTIVSCRSAVHSWTGHQGNLRLVERTTRARNGCFQGQTIAFFRIQVSEANCSKKSSKVRRYVLHVRADGHRRTF